MKTFFTWKIIVVTIILGAVENVSVKNYLDKVKS